MWSWEYRSGVKLSEAWKIRSFYKMFSCVIPGPPKSRKQFSFWLFQDWPHKPILSNNLSSMKKIKHDAGIKEKGQGAIWRGAKQGLWCFKRKLPNSPNATPLRELLREALAESRTDCPLGRETKEWEGNGKAGQPQHSECSAVSSTGWKETEPKL